MIPIKAPKLPTMNTHSNKNKFKCLNLKESSNFQKPSDEILTIFDFHSEILIDVQSVQDFFKIADSVNKCENKNSEMVIKDQARKSFSISSLIENNKLTTYLDSITEGFSAIFDSQEENLDQIILSLMFSFDCLKTIYSIIPSDNEEIPKEEIHYLILNEVERWIVKCCEYPQIKTLVGSLTEILEIRNEIREVSDLLEKISLSYKAILTNSTFKTLINIILKINNILNKENGKKEISNFDICNLDSLLSLKINSKYFIDFVFDSLLASSKESEFQLNKNSFIFSRTELHNFEIITEQSDKSKILNAFEDFNLKLFSQKENLLPILKNNIFMKEFDLFFSGVQNELKELNNLIRLEEKERLKLSDYLCLTTNATIDTFLKNIFKNILTLEKHSKMFLKSKEKTLKSVKFVPDRKETVKESETRIEKNILKEKTNDSINNTSSVPSSLNKKTFTFNSSLNFANKYKLK